MSPPFHKFRNVTPPLLVPHRTDAPVLLVARPLCLPFQKRNSILLSLPSLLPVPPLFSFMSKCHLTHCCRSSPTCRGHRSFCEREINAGYIFLSLCPLLLSAPPSGRCSSSPITGGQFFGSAGFFVERPFSGLVVAVRFSRNTPSPVAPGCRRKGTCPLRLSAVGSGFSSHPSVIQEIPLRSFRRGEDPGSFPCKTDHSFLVLQ